MTWAAFVKTAYQAAREWGIQPSEFWALSPAEWWAEFDSKMRAQKRMKIGMGGVSQADWDEAVRKHKAKVKHG